MCMMLKLNTYFSDLNFPRRLNLFNDLGEDHIVEFFLIADNFHNILKAIIINYLQN